MIFLFESKMGRKAEEKTQHQQQVWPRSCGRIHSAVVVQEVCKGDESSGGEQRSGQPQEAHSHQPRAVVGAQPPTQSSLRRKLPKNNIGHSTITGIWSRRSSARLSCSVVSDSS